MKAIYSYLTWVPLATVMLSVAGCSNDQHGKYTEEQMRQIQFPRKYNLPEASGNSMVLDVLSETITSDEILASIERYLREPAGRMDSKAFTALALPYVREAVKGKITDILLYQEARKTAPDTIDDMLDKAVDSEISKFVASYGNNYALAENKIKEMGYDWRSFREFQRKLIMTQSYLSKQIKNEKRFSQQQLQEYYNQNKEEFFCSDGNVGFSLIEIRPDELNTSQIHEGENSLEAAQRIGQEVAAKVKDGDDFAKLAKSYHGDLAAAGGKVLPVIPGAKALPEPYNSLEARAVQLHPGQIVGPILIDKMVFIVRLDEYDAGGCKEFHEVQHLIEQQLLFEYRQQRYNEVVDTLVIKTDMTQFNRFTEFCVQQAYDQWSQSSEQTPVTWNQ